MIRSIFLRRKKLGKHIKRISLKFTIYPCDRIQIKVKYIYPVICKESFFFRGYRGSCCASTKRVVPIKNEGTKINIHRMGILSHEGNMRRLEEDVASAYIKAMKSLQLLYGLTTVQTKIRIRLCIQPSHNL